MRCLILLQEPDSQAGIYQIFYFLRKFLKIENWRIKFVGTNANKQTFPNLQLWKNTPNYLRNNKLFQFCFFFIHRTIEKNRHSYVCRWQLLRDILFFNDRHERRRFPGCCITRAAFRCESLRFDAGIGCYVCFSICCHFLFSCGPQGRPTGCRGPHITLKGCDPHNTQRYTLNLRPQHVCVRVYGWQIYTPRRALDVEFLCDFVFLLRRHS